MNSSAPPTDTPEHTAALALGSNLGDRREFLAHGLRLLADRPGVKLVRVSTFHETTAVGGPPGQRPYLNAAAVVRTTLTPLELIRVLLEIEQQLGRVRLERDGPRTLDLDVLLYDDLRLEGAELTVPHPRMHQRRFVLAPLAEIAPELIHSVLGRTIFQLLRDCPPEPTAHRELLGRRALVTGATSGIGKAIALELARAGADVIVHGRRADAADAVVQQLQLLGVRSQRMLADLATADGCRQLLTNVGNGADYPDIWVNNAGADTLTGPAADWPFERKLDELLSVDLRATMLLSRAVGSRLQAEQGGVILTMGWDQAETGMEGDSGQLFAAVKGAIEAFTRSLALSLAPAVRVNCLAPGWIRTAWGDGASSQWHERVRRETPLRRWGTPEDVAATARWLVGPAASFLTGQTIRVNGGAVR